MTLEGTTETGRTTNERVRHSVHDDDGERIAYEGSWADGKQTAWKSYDDEGAAACEGFWKHDQYDGNGTLFHTSGSFSYRGEWKEGKFHGVGSEYRTDGTLQYHGEHREGLRNGAGKLYCSDGFLAYEGHWSNGRGHGQGKLYFSDGSIAYDGQWKDGNRTGEGKTYFEGRHVLEHEGEYKDGLRSGYGKAYRPCGTLLYDGEWKRDAYHGTGREYNKDGTTIKWEGEFVSGRFHNGLTIKKRKAREEVVRERDRVAKVHDSSPHVADVPQCAICMGHMHHGDATFVYVPCGHRVVCGGCEPSLDARWKEACFLCRRSSTLVRVYG